MKAKLVLSGAFGCIIGLIIGATPPMLSGIETANKLVACEHRATVAEVQNEEWCGPAILKKISCEDRELACFCQPIPKNSGLLQK